MVCSSVSADIAQGGVDESYTLENGLKVILAPQLDNQVISAMVLVKTGSADEKGQAEFGLAHLMEHMAFKGTKKRKVGQVSSEVENNGGHINAYTTFDETVYYLSLPSDKVELGLDILSDIVFSPSYDPKEYALEKEVVVEEIKRARDNPEHVMWDEFISRIFASHPYGHPVLGSIDTVRNATRDTALAFHDKFYRPDNAILVLTGGFDTAQSKSLLDKYFNDLKNPSEPNPSSVIEPPAPPKGPSIVIKESERVNVPKVMMGFRCATRRFADSAQLDLLSSVLSQGRSGRLTDNVKIKKSLATDIDTSSLTLLLDGILLINYETEPNKIVPAFKAVIEELKGLAENPPAEEELNRAKALAAKAFVDRQESSGDLASLLGTFEIYAGDYRLRDAYLPLWSRVTALDLARLAEKIFRPENMTLSILLPAGAPKPSESEMKEIIAELKLTAPIPTSAAAYNFEEHKLATGPKVLILRDPTLPLVTVRLAVMGGILAEGGEQDGLSNIVAKVWPKGTQNIPSQQFSRSVEDLGASIDGLSGRNSIGLAGSFLSSNWLSGLDLLIGALIEPSFEESVVEEFKAEILSELNLLDEQMANRLFRLLRHELYGDHPYHRYPLGKKETVASFTREDLLNFYQKRVRPDNLEVTVAGDIDPKAVLEALEERLGRWKPAGAGLETAVPAPPKAIDNLKTVNDVVDSAQTHLGLAFLAPGLGHADQAALEVLDSYLSGMGGPLFNELRNKRSLAYTVGSSYNPGLSTGAFSFYIATDPQKVDEAIKGLLEIIEDVSKKPRTINEVQGAITYLTGLKKISLQTLASRAEQAIFNSLYGLGLDFETKHLQAIEKVTPADLQRVALNYLNREHMVLAAVGNEKSIQAAEAALK
ncbi:MAG: insulinase family protein [Deltaproteobacteria bacterium]|nr:insulinase family protein [Deltaproteobacteria bacterium]